MKNSLFPDAGTFVLHGKMVSTEAMVLYMGFTVFSVLSGCPGGHTWR